MAEATPKKRLVGPEAAAAAMPPMTDEAIAVVARIFAAVEARRARQQEDSRPAGVRTAA